ncbi:unnamed protein product, partial [Brachionus calyciflorus]
VNVEQIPHNLTVVISDVEKNLNTSTDDTGIKQVEKAEKINQQQNSKHKLKLHKVNPNIKCGNLSHREKECNNEACCPRCGKNQYPISECDKYCINCTGQHPCKSELCQKLVKKTFSLNRYTLEILIGEGIIKNEEEILKMPKSIYDQRRPKNFEQLLVVSVYDEQAIPLKADDKNLEKYIENYISKIMTNIDVKINSIKQANKLNKKILKIDKLNSNQNDTKAGIDELKAILLATAKINLSNNQTKA